MTAEKWPVKNVCRRRAVSNNRGGSESDAKRQACCCHFISASRYHKAPERGDLFSFLLFLPDFFLVIFPFFAPLIVFPPKKWCTVKVAAYTSAESISEYRKRKMACLQLTSCTMRSSHNLKRNCNAASCKKVSEQKCLSAAYKHNVFTKSQQTNLTKSGRSINHDI